MKPKNPLRILVVEDEILIALGLEILLEDAGHHIVGIATTSEDALALARSGQPRVALVDVHLADGPTGIDTARALVGQGVAVFFTTANVRRIPDDFVGACGIIPKPYTERSVLDALSDLDDRLSGRPGGPFDGLAPPTEFQARGGQTPRRAAENGSAAVGK